MARKFTSHSLVVASHNQDKIKEISLCFAHTGIKIFSSKDFNLYEPEETGNTYLENALIRACMAATHLPALADDSGIEVEALFGQPGLDTAPYTKKLGGRDQVFALWQNLPAIKANAKAQFMCTQVLLWPDEHYEHFETIVYGTLTFPPRGSYGHGYDPIFIPAGHTKTMAEMPWSEKKNFSHRSLTLDKLIRLSKIS
jgi:XTP/dITP diphosphohydrolase